MHIGGRIRPFRSRPKKGRKVSVIGCRKMVMLGYYFPVNPCHHNNAVPYSTLPAATSFFLLSRYRVATSFVLGSLAYFFNVSLSAFSRKSIVFITSEICMVFWNRGSVKSTRWLSENRITTGCA